MAWYKYQLREQTGSVTAGRVQAASINEAAVMLRNGGGTLMDVSVDGGSARGWYAKLKSVSIGGGPGAKDVLGFTSQLAVMIKAGISIRGAVEGIAEQTEKPAFKKIVDRIRQDVEAGKPFSEALSRYPKIFSPLYVNMVKASEMSGSFGKMLNRIAAYLRQQAETRSMVIGAMVYPCIIGVMAIGATMFLLTFVLPKFSTLFAGKERLLPAPTKFLLGLSGFLRNDWYIVVGGLAALVIGFLYFLKTDFGRIWWDGVKLKAPLLKRMFRAMYITRGMQTMGEMINAGVPMLDAIQITGEVSGNAHYRNMWGNVFRSVKAGKKISAPLAHYKLLPRNVVQMISAGEESGKLGEVLADISDFYSVELRNTIKMVTAMIEPLMIVAMGGIVGFIAMSIILPIFKMSSLVK